jgi:hypothetical protein
MQTHVYSRAEPAPIVIPKPIPIASSKAPGHAGLSDLLLELIPIALSPGKGMTLFQVEIASFQIFPNPEEVSR